MNGRNSGLDPRYAAPLCYVLGPITGIYFLLTEKSDRTIRFHAWQSVLLGFGLWALVILTEMIAGLLLYIPVVRDLSYFLVMGLRMTVGWVWLIATVFMVVKAYQGDRYQLPVIGDLASQNAYR